MAPAMSPLQKIAAAVLLVLLAATGYGLWSTSQSASSPVGVLKGPPAPAAGSAAGAAPAIDQNTLLIAHRLALHATTPEELPLARMAEQLADHELDLAFDGAMRHIEAHPPVLSPQALEIQARLVRAQQRLQGGGARVKRLTEALARAEDANKPAIQDQLDLAQAQQELDQDEVTQANDDLMQAGGNVHQRIELMRQQHEAAEHNRPPAPPPAASPLGT
ncbi:MAG: hypothetical protein ACRETS_06515, partial [Steroidobacteraceae bacterium]